MEEARKLSHAHCKKVLNSNGANYSDEQVAKIRETLYILGQLDYLIFKSILNKQSNGNEKGNTLCKGIH